MGKCSGGRNGEGAVGWLLFLLSNLYRFASTPNSQWKRALTGEKSAQPIPLAGWNPQYGCRRLLGYKLINSSADSCVCHVTCSMDVGWPRSRFMCRAYYQGIVWNTWLFLLFLLPDTATGRINLYKLSGLGFFAARCRYIPIHLGLPR